MLMNVKHETQCPVITNFNKISGLILKRVKAMYGGRTEIAVL